MCKCATVVVEMISIRRHVTMKFAGRLYLACLIVLSTSSSIGSLECGKYAHATRATAAFVSIKADDISVADNIDNAKFTPGNSDDDDYTNRIVNGREATPHEYPWMALLLYKDMAYCAGSVINSYYVLTAAHCVLDYETYGPQARDYRITVALGVHDRITMDHDKARIYNLSKSIVHPKHYEHRYYDDNDVALLKLQPEIRFDNIIRPVCLPNKDEDFTRRAAIVSGWGRKYQNGFTDRYLKEITVEILSREDCELSKLGSLYRKLSAQLLCAYQRNADSCQGDSGGPLVSKVDKNLMVQIGIVSFGKMCGEQSSPGAYAKVTYFLDWILNTTQDATYCKKPEYSPVTMVETDYVYE